MPAERDDTGNASDRTVDRRRFLLGCTTLAAASGLGGFDPLQAAQVQPRRAAQSRPNILFMLSDNVGYGVLSSYNGGISDTPTPRIDSLGAEGLRLTNFNVKNQCTPSRAAILTGRLPIRSGIGKAIAAGAPGGLHPWEITLPEMLGDAGYRTAMFGKWHLGAGQGRLPTDQGLRSGSASKRPTSFTGQGIPGCRSRTWTTSAKPREVSRRTTSSCTTRATRRLVDRMVTDHAVDYIARNAKGDRPFFLYVPFAFAHHPALAHPDFKGKSPAGEFGDSLLEHDHKSRPPARCPHRGGDRGQHRGDLGKRQRAVTAPDGHALVDDWGCWPMARRDRHRAGGQYPYVLPGALARAHTRRADQQPHRVSRGPLPHTCPDRGRQGADGSSDRRRGPTRFLHGVGRRRPIASTCCSFWVSD